MRLCRRNHHSTEMLTEIFEFLNSTICHENNFYLYEMVLFLDVFTRAQLFVVWNFLFFLYLFNGALFNYSKIITRLKNICTKKLPFM
jgi:hypothetical protein